MKNNGNSSSRRKFMSLGFLGGASLITQTVHALDTESGDSETISMLTPDGKLVEVRKAIVDQAESKTKVGNMDILNWMESTKSNKGHGK